MTLHVVPIPYGMTVEEAWAEIVTFGELLEYDPEDPRFQEPLLRWATIEVDD